MKPSNWIRLPSKYGFPDGALVECCKVKISGIRRRGIPASKPIAFAAGEMVAREGA
jgi:hypothetical protein